jgi:carbonic anhydrase
MRRTIASARLSVIVVGLLSFVALAAHAVDNAAPTAEQAWQRLKDGNERFAAGRPIAANVNAARRRHLTAGQHPFAIVLACADSRVPPEIVFNQGLGDLFVVRVAGNVSEPFVLGSIDYAVEHLHVPLIVVLGHDKCGAVAAVLAGTKPAGNLGKLLDEVHLGDHRSADHDAALAEGVENNVRHQANMLSQRSHIIQEHVEQHKLKVVSGVYDLATGRLRWLDSE